MHFFPNNYILDHIRRFQRDQGILNILPRLCDAALELQCAVSLEIDSIKCNDPDCSLHILINPKYEIGEMSLLQQAPTIHLPTIPLHPPSSSCPELNLFLGMGNRCLLLSLMPPAPKDHLRTAVTFNKSFLGTALKFSHSIGC